MPVTLALEQDIGTPQRCSVDIYMYPLVSQVAEIAKDIEWVNKETGSKKYPDVTKWPIKQYTCPRQEDT